LGALGSHGTTLTIPDINQLKLRERLQLSRPQQYFTLYGSYTPDIICRVSKGWEAGSQDEKRNNHTIVDRHRKEAQVAKKRSCTVAP